VGDYLEFLGKENIVITSDEKGELTVTKYMSRETAMNALTGMEEKNSHKDGQKNIVREGSWVVIGGVKLPVNKT